MNKYLLILLLFTAGNTHAAASKWIDEQGNVHYSDMRPPTTAKSQQILDTPDQAESVDNSAVSNVPNTANPAAKDAASKKADNEKAKQEAELRALNKTNCAAARQNLANLKDGMRIAVVDPTTGERAYLDDDQRAKNVEQAQQQITKFCE